MLFEFERLSELIKNLELCDERKDVCFAMNDLGKKLEELIIRFEGIKTTIDVMVDDIVNKIDGEVVKYDFADINEKLATINSLAILDNMEPIVDNWYGLFENIEDRDYDDIVILGDDDFVYEGEDMVVDELSETENTTDGYLGDDEVIGEMLNNIKYHEEVRMILSEYFKDKSDDFESWRLRVFNDKENKY